MNNTEERIAKGFYLAATADELMEWGREEALNVLASSTNFNMTIHSAEFIPLEVDGEYVRYLVKPIAYTMNSPSITELEGNENLKEFRVSLKEFPEDKFTLMFECWAEDSEHAYDQAENAYPGCQLHCAIEIDLL